MTNLALSLRYARAVSAEVMHRLELVTAVPHRGESGRARENCIRDFLRTLIPPHIGVDTGFVVDGVGGISRQIDVVIHRRDYYPIFKIGGVDHYMVESVLAVFEVKASLKSRSELRGALDNIESVKLLDRTGGGSNYTLPVALVRRSEDMSDLEVVRRAVNPDVYQCQIFSGIITEQTLGPDVLLDTLVEFIAERPRRLWPNIYVALRDYALQYREPGGRITEDANHASGLALSDPSSRSSEVPLVDLAIALANILRVSARIDYNPSNYFRESKAQMRERALPDETFPGRSEADGRLPGGSLSS